MSVKHLPGRHDQSSHGRRHPGGRPGRPSRRQSSAGSLVDRLSSGEVSSEVLGGGRWAKVDLVMLGDGSRVVRKAQLKPIEGRPAKEVQDAEELGSKVLRLFGVQAPETHRASARVVYQEYMEGTSAEQLPQLRGTSRDRAEFYESDQGRILGLADALMYNYDRRKANWLLGSDGSIIGIDHGMAFGWDYHEPGSAHSPTDNAFWEYLTEYQPGTGFAWADNDLAPQDIVTARGRLELLRPEFEGMNRAQWLDNMLITLDAIEPHAKGTRARFS